MSQGKSMALGMKEQIVELKFVSYVYSVHACMHACVWVPEIEPQTSAEVASALNH